MKKVKILSVVIIAALILTGFIAFRISAEGNQTAEVTTDTKVAVKVINAKKIAQSEGSYFKATLEADQEGIVSPKNGGKVTQVLFDDGKQVAKGDALVILDDQDVRDQMKSAASQLEAAKATLAKAEAGLENSQRVYDRVKSLHDQQGASQAELDNAETSLKLVKADVAASQANIKAAQANVDTLETALGNMTVYAPISGIMDGKSVSVGQFLSPGLVIGKVKDISSLDAVIDVDQNAVSSIKTGQKSRVRLSEDSTDTYEGRVKSIGTVADPSSRTFKVKVQVDNKDLSLRPGIYAKVFLDSDSKVELFAIPVEVISGKDGNYFVFVNENGIAKKHAITIGAFVENQVEITSGLQGNEQIISTNLNMLQEGDEVNVISE